MKIISTLLLTSSLCLSAIGDATNTNNTKLTTQIEETDINKDGIVDIITKTTFRGGDKILTEVDRKKINKSNFRLFFCKGTQPLREEDHDYDGVYEKLYFNGTKYDNYEIFVRTKDNKVEPLKSGEYINELTKIRKEIEDSTKELKKAKQSLLKSMAELDAVSENKQKSQEIMKEFQKTLEQAPDDIKFLLKDLEQQNASKEKVN